MNRNKWFSILVKLSISRLQVKIHSQDSQKSNFILFSCIPLRWFGASPNRVTRQRAGQGGLIYTRACLSSSARLSSRVLYFALCVALALAMSNLADVSLPHWSTMNIDCSKRSSQHGKYYVQYCTCVFLLHVVVGF